MKFTTVLPLAVLILAAAAHATSIQPTLIEHGPAEYTGNANLAGALVALVQPEHPQGASLESEWTLNADFIHAERDEAMAPDTDSVIVQTEPQTWSADYRHAQATSHPRTTGYSLGIFPIPNEALPSFTIQAGCVEVATTASGTQNSDTVVGGTQRNERMADVGNALLLQPCKDTTWAMQVKGSYEIISWSWETTITDQDGNPSNWTSGSDPITITPPGTPPVQGKQMKQTYLIVNNGTLVFVSKEPGPLGAYATAFSGDVLGIAAFTDANAKDLRGHLKVEGSFTVISQRVTDHAKTHLTGDVAAASFDGNPHVLDLIAAPRAASPNAAMWGIVLLGAALGALPLGGAIQRHRAAAWNRRHANPRTGHGGHLEQAEYLLRQGKKRQALWYARRATRFDQVDAWAWEIRGRCHHALRQAHRAGRCYEEAYRILHDEAVEVEHQHSLAFRISRTFALRRRGDDASAWLAIAANSHPIFLVRAQNEGDFTRVRRHRDFAALLGRGVEWTTP